MVHDVFGPIARQFPQPGPAAAERGHVHQPFAAEQAHLYPLVVGGQVTAAAGAGEDTAAGGDRPDAGDELGQVAGERHRFARVSVGGHRARQPRLHRPWQRVTRARVAQRDRLGRGKLGAPGQFGRCLGLRLQPAPHLAGVPGFQRESGGIAVANAEDRVDRPGAGHLPHRQVAPARELPVDQRPGRLRRDGQLVLMHPHLARVAHRGHQPQPDFPAKALFPNRKSSGIERERASRRPSIAQAAGEARAREIRWRRRDGRGRMGPTASNRTSQH